MIGCHFVESCSARLDQRDLLVNVHNFIGDMVADSWDMWVDGGTINT